MHGGAPSRRAAPDRLAVASERLRWRGRGRDRLAQVRLGPPSLHGLEGHHVQGDQDLADPPAFEGVRVKPNGCISAMSWSWPHWPIAAELLAPDMTAQQTQARIVERGAAVRADCGDRGPRQERKAGSLGETHPCNTSPGKRASITRGPSPNSPRIKLSRALSRRSRRSGFPRRLGSDLLRSSGNRSAGRRGGRRYIALRSGSCNAPAVYLHDRKPVESLRQEGRPQGDLAVVLPGGQDRRAGRQRLGQEHAAADHGRRREGLPRHRTAGAGDLDRLPAPGADPRPDQGRARQRRAGRRPRPRAARAVR